MVWEENQGNITIRHGGPTPGCVLVALFVIGVGFLVIGILMYLETIVLPFEGQLLPLTVGICLFGLFWILAALRVRQTSVESVVVIDSVNEAVRFQAHRTDKETVIPFSTLQAVVVHETESQDTSYVHSNVTTGDNFSEKQARFSYTYRVYLLKNDGAVFWLYTFSRKEEALEHVQLLLERIEISCIDEAGGLLWRSVANPYAEPVAPTGSDETSPFYRVSTTKNGDTSLSVSYERMEFGGLLALVFLFALFIGCPVWFYAANHLSVPGWFLIIPSVFVFFFLIGIFMRGRRYTVVCTPTFLEMQVRFWFPLFQMLFGKSARVKATDIRAVRVNRYDGGELHLEVAVESENILPVLTRAAFNSGAVRGLPRAVTDDDVQHLGLWAILPQAKRSAGPTMTDLLAAEAKIQSIYRMDSSIA